MKLAAFKDAMGDPVLINIDLIRVMDGDTDNDGELTEIAFDNDHTVVVRGGLQDTFAVIMDAAGQGV